MALAQSNVELNDYESMLVAAGWVALADLDPDYERFRRTTPVDAEFADYDGYLYLKREYTEANAQWMEEIHPLIMDGVSMTWQQRERELQLLKRMSGLEYNLGY